MIDAGTSDVAVFAAGLARHAAGFAAALCLAASPLFAQPTLINVGALSDGQMRSLVDLNVDGSAAVGTGSVPQSVAGSGTAFFRWTLAGGQEYVAALANGGNFGYGLSISADGNTVTGASRASAEQLDTLVWTTGRPLTWLTYATGYVSGDGSVIAGEQRFPNLAPTPFARRGNQSIPLAQLPGSVRGGVRGINHTAGVLVGSLEIASPVGGYRAVWWDGAGLVRPLAMPAGFTSSFGVGVSPSGQFIAGHVSGGTRDVMAIWHVDGGMRTVVPPANVSSIYGQTVSDDGACVFGQMVNRSVFPYVTRGFVWTPALGVMDLATYIAGTGVDLTGWTDMVYTAMSDDATTVGGNGLYLGQPRCFVIRGLSFPRGGCDGIDFNNNTVFPEDADVIDFFNVLAGAECPACNDIDFNNNGVFPEDQDVIDFFNVWAGGACL